MLPTLKSSAEDTLMLNVTNNIAISHQELVYVAALDGGTGSFGTVYKGKYQYTDVAIKQLKKGKLDTDKDLLIKLNREVNAMVNLRSPYVIQIYGACFESPNYAIVMEYMSGGDLFSLLHDQNTVLEWDIRCRYGLDIAKGMAYLHSRKITHCDLKSLNVLLDANKQNAKIADFGLSKMKATDSLLYSTAVPSSAPWTAPEIISSLIYPKYTEAADVYSFAIVLWEIAARKIPYQGYNHYGLLDWVAKGNRETIPEKTPPAMTKLIQDCWQGNAQGRPTMGECVIRLGDIIANQGIFAPKKELPGAYHWLNMIDGHSDIVRCVAVLPSGNTVSGSDDNTLKEWDKTNSKCVKTFEGHSNGILCVAVLPSGNIVSGSRDETLKEWDKISGKCIRTFKGHSDWVRGVVVLPNGNIVSGSDDQMLKEWDKDTGKCVKTFEGHSGDVNCVVLLPNGNIVSGSDDQMLKEWDKDTGKCVKTFEGHSGDVNCVALLPSGNIVSGSNDQMLKEWDKDTGKCVKTFEGHNDLVECVAVLPNGNIVSGSPDGPLKEWDKGTGKCVKTFDGGFEISCIAILPNGNLIGGSGATLEEWNGYTGQRIKMIDRYWRIITLLPNGNIVNETLKEWDKHTGKCVKTFDGCCEVNCVAVLPNGNLVASGSYTLREWDKVTDKCIKKFKHGDYVNCVAVLSNGNIVSGSSDRTLKEWDKDTGKCVKTFLGHSSCVTCVAISSDGNIISGSYDNTLKEWNKDTGQCVKTFVGHDKGVRCLAILPNGNIVSGSDDKMLKEWDKDTGKCVKTFEGHNDRVQCVAVLPSGNIVSGCGYTSLFDEMSGFDNTLKEWDKDTGQCVKTHNYNSPVKCILVLPNGDILSLAEREMKLLKNTAKLELTEQPTLGSPDTEEKKQEPSNCLVM